MSAIFLANQAINTYGAHVSGARCRFYESGTNFTTPLAVYYDDDLTLPVAEGVTFITANDAGLFRPVYLKAEIYAMRFEAPYPSEPDNPDKPGTILQYDIDPYNGTGGSGGLITQDPDRYPSFEALGVLADNEKFGIWVAPITLNLQNDSSRNQAYCDVAPTAAFDILIKHEGSTVITCSFAAGVNAATVTGTGAVAISPGEVLTAHGPATADATAADIAISLYAIEP